MGALARLLARRGDVEKTAAPSRRTAPRKARTPKDLLHASGMSTEELQAAWIAVSWLLTYPDEATLERLPLLRELSASLPERAREGVRATVAALERRDPVSVQEEYVDTFDTRRRGCLHLTYFSHGDTRRRGMALLRIKQDFRAVGLEIGSDELPDHLPVVLEFAAAHDPGRGAKILRANRPGVELLRLHLEEIASPWHGALVALCATLPPLDAEDRAAVMKLAEEGPEDELVGLDGYGLDGAAGDMAGQTFATSPSDACGSHAGGSRAAAPGPVPVDLMRGRPS
ncbi:Respiratory nitrate reductase delta chain [Brachybacterium faecium]|uniref:Nitrate reductase molybdenum cofactor assembly chaperone n=1 Tax=Brachybacterium faecium (strain ATCC 43885 / DSM 4810 / JCM 11609 / LMG 19847 / NBRC 14762 / NCIMB 9860 / 6-10) TaxID=446465 RepID=C7MDM9_BRAFD|nr:nitrate reductase molybdenum cofactor assembly chaperone [Brachybacterium faecium]ACU85686.1 nitrate reductase molybdenum cofactor assembly chaperone [Brachybacterium faecium DSM 4810]SLM99813.1 Respiratory nitrate reductase delta chain [Brachybacterium faecium]HJG50970.1 nitrate reductase molybdenum cofactor assembly chaperone [Brachybacterium faecium]